MDNLKNITIGVVTYNNADEIGELLDSITECSSFHDLTVYLYDNASTDNTAGVVKEKYPWVRLIKGKKNLGFGRAHNEIIKLVKSKYHIIVGPDVNIHTDTITDAVKYLDDNPDIAVLTPFVLNPDGTQQYLPKRNPKLKYLLGGTFENKFKWAARLRAEYTLKDKVITEPIDVEFCTGAFMFTRTDMLIGVGGFDDRYFLYSEDADLTRKLRSIGRAVYVPNIRITHKWHRDNRRWRKKTFWIALHSNIKYMMKWSKM